VRHSSVQGICWFSVLFIHAACSTPTAQGPTQPSCSDGLLNGTESGVDCGGSCPACPNGAPCTKGTDCKSGTCVQNICTAHACDDGAANGDETDTDCGGSCSPCADGSACGAATDCKSGICMGNKCVPPSCMDKLKNGSETDVDCGGTCMDCGDGKACVAPGDCASGVCTGMKCAAVSCMDKVKNGTESDVDCGGSCPGCADDMSCTMPSDCLSGTCTAMKCAKPSCTDKAKNGTETGIDCGGPTCGTCAANGGCKGNGDCASGNCNNGACVGDVAVFCMAAPVNSSPILNVGSIPSYPGRKVRIVKLGICGDADMTSGMQGFRAYDGMGLDFTWGAGQANQGPATYFLQPTPNLGGAARGFSYMTVDLLTQAATTVQIDFQFRFDYDGLFCQAMDEDGVSYTDMGSSVRAWLKYRYE
jgi:hypothetical protein